MASKLSIILVIPLLVNITVSLEIIRQPMISVRRGEELHMPCAVKLEASDSLSLVRWYRGTEVEPYGAIDVSGGCGLPEYPCPVVNTADSRGLVQYVKNEKNDATLALAIYNTTLDDNTRFYCAFLEGGIQLSARVMVTVYYLPQMAYPTCTLLLDITGTSGAVLNCSSEKAQPVVSLEWTTLVISSRVSLLSDTVIVGDHVENTLHLNTLDSSCCNLVFTCYMRSEAYPGISRNCSVRPNTGTSVIPTTISTSPDTKTSLASLITTSQEHGVTSKTPGIDVTDGYHQTSRVRSDQDTTSPTATVDIFVPIPVNSSVFTAVSAGSASVAFVLLLLVAYLAASRRKLQKQCNDLRQQLATANPSNTRSSDGHDLVEPQRISLHTLPSDTRDSANSSHSYETRIGYTVAELHPQEPDQRRQGKSPATGPTVDRLQPQYTEDGYTQYIVEDNNGNQTTSSTDYTPLSAYEEVGHAEPCDYEHPNGQ